MGEIEAYVGVFWVIFYNDIGGFLNVDLGRIH